MSRPRGEEIVGMISLETIGYDSDARGSQEYPPPYDRFFLSTGNFIGLVADGATAGRGCGAASGAARGSDQRGARFSCQRWR